MKTLNTMEKKINKVLILGQPNTGKSTFVNIYDKNKSIIKNDKIIICETNCIDQKIFESNDIKGVIIFCDGKLDNIKEWVNEIRQCVTNHIVLYLVVNKNDTIDILKLNVKLYEDVIREFNEIFFISCISTNINDIVIINIMKKLNDDMLLLENTDNNKTETNEFVVQRDIINKSMSDNKMSRILSASELRVMRLIKIISFIFDHACKRTKEYVYNCEIHNLSDIKNIQFIVSYFLDLEYDCGYSIKTSDKFGLITLSW